jgi:hypothetical protein
VIGTSDQLCLIEHTVDPRQTFTGSLRETHLGSGQRLLKIPAANGAGSNAESIKIQRQHRWKGAAKLLMLFGTQLWLTER